MPDTSPVRTPFARSLPRRLRAVAWAVCLSLATASCSSVPGVGQGSQQEADQEARRIADMLDACTRDFVGTTVRDTLCADLELQAARLPCR